LKFSKGCQQRQSRPGASPLGNIMNVRKEVYRQSSLLHHQINNQSRKEPKNLGEVFDS
jgi:hypothetical protein